MTLLDVFVPFAPKMVSAATGMSFKSPQRAAERVRPVDEMCRNVPRCADRRGESMHNELSIEGSESVALLVREELARRRLSRQWLADEARLSLSTLEKALAGSRPFTLATVVRIEDALGTSLRNSRPAPDQPAGMFAP